MDYDKFFRLAPDLFCVANQAGYFTHVNPAWTRALGWGPEELLSNTFFHFVHPDDLAKTEKAFQALMKREVVSGFQNRYRCRDGSYRWLEWGALMVDAENLIYASARDISDQKRSQDRLTTLTEHIPALIYEFVSKPSGEIYFTYLSKAYESMLGPPDEALFSDARERIASYIHPEDVRRFFMEFQKSLNQLTRFEWEGRIRSPKGEYRIIQALSNPRSTELNEVIWAGFMRDVTDDRRLEEELLVERRRVEASSKMALLGEMAGGIAHEINTPLAVIMGRASQLNLLLKRDDASKETIQRILGEINSTADRLSHIVRSLRSFTRDTHQDPLQDVGLAKIIKDTLAICSSELKEKDILLTLKPKEIPDTWVLCCRQVEVSQILLNLIQNSIDAISEGQSSTRGEIDLEVNRTSRPAGVSIFVSDNGPGVAPSIRDRLMKAFVTTKPADKGTGLGLSISRRLAEAQGGSLEFLGNHPQTVFRLWLPMSKTAS